MKISAGMLIFYVILAMVIFGFAIAMDMHLYSSHSKEVPTWDKHANMNVPIHPYCIPHTPQWPSCIPKTTKCSPGWKSALAGMYHCKD